MVYNNIIPAHLLLEEASNNGLYAQLELPLSMPPEYTLPEDYFCSLKTGYEWIPSDSNMKCSSIQCVDHPGFTRLRDELDVTGYIKKETAYINGDVVLKTFVLNDVTFNPNDQFPCAAAIGNVLKRKGKK